MTTQPVEAPAEKKQAPGDKLRHIYCMKHGIPETGICGAPRNKAVSEMRPLTHEAEAQSNRCVVCDDLKLLPCSICGD